MEQLYIVRICKFNCKEKTEYGYRYIIDENSFKEFIGVKRDNTFINTNDGISYRSLKKNGNYIDETEEKNINFYEYYVNNVEIYKEPTEKSKPKNYLINLRNLITKGGKQKKKTR